MGKRLDLIGKKFGRLTVVEYAGKDKWKHSLYKCKCDCGSEKIILKNSLLSQRTKSCGCYKKERTHNTHFIDLVGRTFGRLFVEEYVGKNNKGKFLYLCKCNCGNKIITKGCYLLKGDTISCGCYRKEKLHEINFKDLTGKKFGKLFVKEYVGYNKRGSSLFLCICDCGKEIVIIGSNLTKENTKSCGCYKKERIRETNFKDLTGKKFGRLTVNEFKTFNVNKESLWSCLCDCGKEVIVQGSSLTTGNTTSCGCYQKERAKEANSRENCHFWKGGISFEPYCPKFNNDLRKRIRLFFNNECIICGKSKEENKKELSCHHVEYNKKSLL